MTARPLPEFCFFKWPPRVSSGEQAPPAVNVRGNWDWWVPSCSWRTPGVGCLDSLTFLAFHYGWIYETREFCALMFILDGQTVHRSVVFPRWFRFPFMARTDLQIGNIWTAPAFRGQGIATRAVHEVRRRFGDQRTLWYLTHAGNAASRRVAEKNRFDLVGTGVRKPALGLNLLGQFTITKKQDELQ